MKKILSILCILLIVLLLFPIRAQAKDGGTVEYRSMIYTVRDMHQIHHIENDDGSVTYGYIVGFVIEVLGQEVFNNTKFKAEE